MGNIIPSLCSSALSRPNSEYQVFINHRGKDTKQSFASLVFHSLENRGFKVFFDKISLKEGQCVPQAIEHAIRSASVHVVILSPNYAQSEWCLNELLSIRKTRAPIVPVFWGIRPSDVRMENKNGVYAKSFQEHKQAGKFKNCKLKKWKNALRRVSLLEGFIIEGDQGEMLEKVTASVAQYIEKT